jgi:5-methylthioribose kinase
MAQALANPHMHGLFDYFIFEETFFHKKAINPLVEDEVAQLLADEALQREVLLLRNRYNTCPQTIIHNDFHTSNICVGETAVKIFDAESATFGPIGFDLGRLIGNLVLNYASWEGIDAISAAEKDDFRDFILASITEIYQQFTQTFSTLWLAEARPEYRRVESFLDVYLCQVLQDLVGFAGCVCLARIYDDAECYEYQKFRTLEQKADAQRLAMHLTKALIMKRTKIETIHDLTALIEETAFAYRLEKVVTQVVLRQLFG